MLCRCSVGATATLCRPLRPLVPDPFLLQLLEDPQVMGSPTEARALLQIFTASREISFTAVTDLAGTVLHSSGPTTPVPNTIGPVQIVNQVRWV